MVSWPEGQGEFHDAVERLGHYGIRVTKLTKGRGILLEDDPEVLVDAKFRLGLPDPIFPALVWATTVDGLEDLALYSRLPKRIIPRRGSALGHIEGVRRYPRILRRRTVPTASGAPVSRSLLELDLRPYGLVLSKSPRGWIVTARDALVGKYRWTARFLNLKSAQRYLYELQRRFSRPAYFVAGELITERPPKEFSLRGWERERILTRRGLRLKEVTINGSACELTIRDSVDRRITWRMTFQPFRNVDAYLIELVRHASYASPVGHLVFARRKSKGAGVVVIRGGRRELAKELARWGMTLGARRVRTGWSVHAADAISRRKWVAHFPSFAAIRRYLVRLLGIEAVPSYVSHGVGVIDL